MMGFMKKLPALPKTSVGELLLADADDLVTYITGSRRRRASLHALTEVSIVELQMGVLGEAKEDVRDDVVSCLGLLEEAMAIAVVALLDSESDAPHPYDDAPYAPRG